MNSAIVEVMNATGHTLPEAHHDAGLMAALAATQAATGFETSGSPSHDGRGRSAGERDRFRHPACEPKIARNSTLLRGVSFRDQREPLGSGRVRTVANAIHRLAVSHPDQPVIASLTGPVSTAASSSI
jgi:[methyl-Co(III) methanol-specific corrinoid protein]:coenzyme M methyltransferase